MTSFSFTVPLVPPSVNHYWKRKRGGGYYLSEYARNWHYVFGICSIRLREECPCSVKARYEVEARIFLGKGQKGDGDNFWKAIGDGLVKCGVIHSDSAVDHWLLYKSRDPKNPRTEITVRVL